MVVDEQDGPCHEELDVVGAFHGEDIQRHGLVDVRKGGAGRWDVGYQDAQDAERQDVDHQEADHHLDAASKRT